jgi:hypothetical protein
MSTSERHSFDIGDPVRWTRRDLTKRGFSVFEVYGRITKISKSGKVAIVKNFDLTDTKKQVIETNKLRRP